MYRLLVALRAPPPLPLPNIGCSCWAARSPAAQAMVNTATRCEPCERRRPRRTTGDGGPSSRGMSRGTPAVTGGGGAHARRAEDQTGRTPFSSAAPSPETPLIITRGGHIASVSLRVLHRDLPSKTMSFGGQMIKADRKVAPALVLALSVALEAARAGPSCPRASTHRRLPGTLEPVTAFCTPV